MATKNLSMVETFDIQHDIRDFCTERGRGLTTVTPSTNRSNVSLNSSTTNTTTTTSNNTNNNTTNTISPNLNPTPTSSSNGENNVFTRERSSTNISNDSHRSSNKCKKL